MSVEFRHSIPQRVTVSIQMIAIDVCQDGYVDSCFEHSIQLKTT